MSFNPTPLLSYLSLPTEYQPSPEDEPIGFLTKHIHQLPPHLLNHFSTITSPKQRTSIRTIRNRRLKYTQSQPPELSFDAARQTWPTLWHGRERRGQDEGKDERQWAEKEFLGGKKQLIGKLGSLLGEYEEEREAERVRALRRQAAEADFVPEEDESEDESEDEGPIAELPQSPEEVRTEFERQIKERFIYGLLDSIDYDLVDWDDQWDEQADRDEEERWFDEEEPDE